MAHEPLTLGCADIAQQLLPVAESPQHQQRGTCAQAAGVPPSHTTSRQRHTDSILLCDLWCAAGLIPDGRHVLSWKDRVRLNNMSGDIPSQLFNACLLGGATPPAPAVTGPLLHVHAHATTD